MGIVSGTAGFPEIVAETDDEGHYQISSVPPGTFQVTVHDRDGEKIGQERIAVNSGATATPNFSIPAAVTARPDPTPGTSAISAKQPTEGLCLPSIPLAVTVGDTWTISGPARVPAGFPSELPEGVAEMSTTFTVSEIGTTTYVAGRGSTPIDHPDIELQVTTVMLDGEGNVLSTEDSSGSWSPASVVNLGPVLTPDWECHQKAWLSAWPPEAQPSVGERTLSSGITAVVFTVRQPFVILAQGIDATAERDHGYEKLTGRSVLGEFRTTGTINGEPFIMEILQEIESAGASVAPSTTGPGSCREYLNLLVSIDEGSTEEPAVATSYGCMSLHVDSTAQYPAKAPSLALTQGVPLSLRLGVERKPVALELRLYSGAGIYGSFGKWPEELFFDEGPVDTLQPTPSLAFQYLPQQSPGEYSLVVRAIWDGPIAVFYATSFKLQ